MSAPYLKRAVRFAIETVILAAVLFAVFAWGMQHGKREAMKTALSTNPVSEELEMVCLSIWATEQNKKVNPK